MIDIPKDPKNKRYYKGAPKPAWGTMPDGMVWLRCPNCGVTANLSESHTIAADGTVNPSIWHQCGSSGGNDSGDDWHIFGRLIDY